VLEAARKRYEEGGITAVVIASETGRSARQTLGECWYFKFKNKN